VDVGGKIHALIETEMHIRLSMPRNGGANVYFGMSSGKGSKARLNFAKGKIT
jgi:hypothetical protein